MTKSNNFAGLIDSLDYQFFSFPLLPLASYDTHCLDFSPTTLATTPIPLQNYLPLEIIICLNSSGPTSSLHCLPRCLQSYPWLQLPPLLR